jgi:hypothetical protein
MKNFLQFLILAFTVSIYEAAGILHLLTFQSEESLMNGVININF